MLTQIYSRIRFVLPAVFLMLYSASALSVPADLVFLNWSEYLDEEVVKSFEEKYNAKLRMVYFNSEDERNSQLLNTGGKGFDLVLVPSNLLEEYRAAGWIHALDESKLPNLKHIDPRWVVRDKGILYSVPYAWGTTGIAYRKDLLKDKISSWRHLYNPKEEWKNKITLLGDANEVVAAAFKSLGYSLNETGREAFQKAEELLLNQRPYVKHYALGPLNEQNDLVTGKTWISMIYNGDALLLKNEYESNIAYVVPEEGTMLWADHIAMLPAAQNPDLAMAFINFLHEPENAAKTSLSLFYATANKAAESLLPAEHMQNEGIYPPKAVLEKSEFYTVTAPRTLKKNNQIFSKIAR